MKSDESNQPDWVDLWKRTHRTARGLGYPREIAWDVAGNLFVRFLARSRFRIRSDYLKTEIHKEAARLRRPEASPIDDAMGSTCGMSPRYIDNDEAEGLAELFRESTLRTCTPRQQELLIKVIDGEEPDRDVSRQTRKEHIGKGTARALLGMIPLAYEAHVNALADYYFTPWLANYGLHTSEMLQEFETITKSLKPAEVDKWKGALSWLIPKVSQRAFDALNGTAPGVTAAPVLFFLYYCAVRLGTDDFTGLMRETRRQAIERNLNKNPHVKRHLATIASYMGNQGDQITNLRDPAFLLHEFVEGLIFSQNGPRSGLSVNNQISGRSASILDQARRREKGPSRLLKYVEKRLPDPNYRSPALSLMLLRWAEQALILMEDRNWNLSSDQALSLVSKLDREPHLRERETRASLGRVRDKIHDRAA